MPPLYALYGLGTATIQGVDYFRIMKGISCVGLEGSQLKHMGVVNVCQKYNANAEKDSRSHL